MCSEGLKASIQATIKDRTSKVKGSIYKLRSLIKDFRMQVVGGIRAAIDLFESCIVPSLLSNCGTWTGITEQEEKLLDEHQNLFCWAILQVPVSSPRSSLRASFGLVGMKWRVMEAKLHKVQAIRSQEEGGLARDVLEEQLNMGFPGLGQEVSQICREIGLPDASRQEVNKEDISEAIKANHLKILNTEMVGKVKLEELARADTRRAQEYVEWGVEDCRMAYRLQTKMFDCRANMPAKYKRDLECRACRPNTTIGQEIQEETQERIEVCQGYRALWVGLGPLTPLSRVKYFIHVKNQKAKMQNIS